MVLIQCNNVVQYLTLQSINHFYWVISTPTVPHNTLLVWYGGMHTLFFYSVGCN